ncbi:MAG: hypothetical protein SPJ99_06990 [Candidatus Coprenecus sp.]|nr:hypothetical protein [Candidatus Coprenecus sp.]
MQKDAENKSEPSVLLVGVNDNNNMLVSVTNHKIKQDSAMSYYYDNDYTDDMYDLYMHTGEGAEYFEDTPEDEDIEEIITGRVVEYKNLNEQLDDVIRSLKQQIKEKERIIKAQKKKTAPKKKTAKKK